MPHLGHGAWASGDIPFVLIVLLLTASMYLRGWRRLRSRSPDRIPAWRAASLLLGLFLVWVAVASPMAAFDHELLVVHMIQHLLLMSIAAPLILLGAPVIALQHALPRRFARAVVDPLSRWPPAQRLGRTLAQPALCWIAAAGVLVGWHVPALLTLGLQSDRWHVVQHASFFAAGLLFWWPVVQPWPSMSKPGWSIVLYLFLATLPCDILSAFLVFSERVAYPLYLSTPRQSGLSVLDDQQAAGALMWTCVTVVYLVAGAVLSARLLSPQKVVR